MNARAGWNLISLQLKQMRCALFLGVIVATIMGTALSLFLSTLLMEFVFTFSRNAPIKLTASTLASPSCAKRQAPNEFKKCYR